MKKVISTWLALSIVYFVQAQQSKSNPSGKCNAVKEPYSAYLFVYFTGNSKSDEAIRFAISNDGYHYRALNSNKAVISSETISSTGGVRDPHIIRGADGKTFYMVVTDMVSALGWNSNRAMVLLKSTDLINWTSSVINIQKRYPGNDSLLRVWAPQTIYDAKAGKYMIYFSMKHGNDPDKIYYAYANKEFTDFEGEPKQLFFHPQNVSCIDGDIMYALGKYHLFFKTEGAGNGIKQAVSDNLTEGYVMEDKYLQGTTDPVEGAGTFKLNNANEWILMYDVYTKGKYQFTKTKDLQQFTVIDKDMTMNFHPRHGTVMSITRQEAERLVKQWLPFDDVITNVTSKQVKPINVVFDTAKKTVTIPVMPGTNLNNFNPGIVTYPGVSVTAKTSNFTNGPVKYTVSIAGKGSQQYSVIAKEYHNAALVGYYADPDIIYAEKTGKFYIYPTSDGFNGWSGTYFKCFSSGDLVNWKDEGVILDLNKDVSWAKRNAWAPCIVEKKINGQYKYFYYFTAAQKIGVAVSDNPTGPFVDSGKPLIADKPEEVKGGQVIDPDVFTDPKTGKSYLYWGNGFMAGAELSEDMTSIKQETVTILKPDRTFREGTHVFYRNDTYYFTWSENDTRDPDYRVRYGTTDGPLGKINIPENNIVIAKDTALEIYGTGHHTTIQIPGKDEWYIVYHRFNYPKGITMGEAAGYNREVCIDKLEFNADGSIKPAKPTHTGIKPVVLKRK
ncbi:beta-xylosidase [Niastella caeni]|uniref:Beta-xylosidase n=1 Tax=Niastella caeni TaxID=2569763 RepID=A0A4S8I172_9BACT|nr:family 43 glycosylhydrolase [Niastella caeni]THU40244.1 beta-xylosidase [Niastella caeni]